MTTDLPHPMARLTEGLLGRVPPAETHATCSTCALCPGGGDGRRPMGRNRLQPDVKCCTDQPVLPNYLVGGILAEGTEAGRRTLRARMAQASVSPLGVGGIPGAPGFVGQASAPCPHLDEGGCSIHGFRNAGCATWFCKHERGLYGQRAWVALRAWMRGVESRLAMWCVREAGLPPTVVQHLVAMSGSVPGIAADGSVPDEVLWGSISDREAYFVACHERVAELSWGDVRELGDPAVSLLATIARAAWERLDAPLPPVLRPGIHQVVAMGPDGVLAETYSSTDPIGLPSLLLAVLHHFDGRPTAEVLDQLAREQGLALEASFLQELVDFNVLSGVSGGT